MTVQYTQVSFCVWVCVLWGFVGEGGQISRESGWTKDNDSCILKRITWGSPVIMHLPLWDYRHHFHLLNLTQQYRAKPSKYLCTDTASKPQHEREGGWSC